RERGRAQGHIWANSWTLLDPALSSVPRQKRHYRGRRLPPGPGGDGLARLASRLVHVIALPKPPPTAPPDHADPEPEHHIAA
ncbi:MAG: hypothetical protein O7I42_26550, partial [Alphaproteobacteria bacterium]|nr:hypothetical protein [Alphaproteobacteria bacterium]